MDIPRSKILEYSEMNNPLSIVFKNAPKLNLMILKLDLFILRLKLMIFKLNLMILDLT